MVVAQAPYGARGLLMFRSVAARTTTLITTALVAAGILVMLTSVGPEAKAAGPVVSAVPDALAKADRLPAVLFGSAYSAQAWPNYEDRCLFDQRAPGKASGAVRIIALQNGGR